MKIFVIFAALVAVACAQYDYKPPTQSFDAGGERPVYGTPNHTPGTPLGPSSGVAQVGAEAPDFSSPYSHPHRPQVSAPVSSHRPQVSAPAPTFSQSPAFAPSFAQAPIQQQEQQNENYTPKVFRHVYVHSAPDEPEDRQSRTVRVPGGDKHVNIIFVKTPSQSSSSQTEVILPEQDEHKNLVYVLLKKGENTADVKIRKPASTPQPKPQVYFIRYGGQQQGQQGGYQQQQQTSSENLGGGHQGGGGYQQQAPVGIRAPSPIRTPADIPSSGYGLPL